jgi:hypothetical protein
MLDPGPEPTAGGSSGLGISVEVRPFGDSGCSTAIIVAAAALE